MLEIMYQDFVTNLLPKINEGLVITKDYFFDLFGRYVKYLIVTDSIKIVIGLILIIGSVIAVKKLISYGRKNHWDGEYVGVCLLVFPIIVGLILLFDNTFNLVKDIYIPEIRIIEIMNKFRK